MEAGAVTTARVQSRDEHAVDLADDVVQAVQGFDRLLRFPSLLEHAATARAAKSTAAALFMGMTLDLSC